MRIYLDTSVLNRPFDDQTQARIHLETEAFLAVLDGVIVGKFTLLNAAVLRFENAANPFPNRKMKGQSYLSLARDMVHLDRAVRQRGKVLEALGVKPIDALHIAAAEHGQADVLITCDERLIKTAQRYEGSLPVKVRSILSFIAEEI